MPSDTTVKMLAAGCFFTSQCGIDVLVLTFMIESVNTLENKFYNAIFKLSFSATQVCLHAELSLCVTVLRCHLLWGSLNVSVWW